MPLLWDFSKVLQDRPQERNISSDKTNSSPLPFFPFQTSETWELPMAHLSLLTCSVHHQIFSPKYFNHLSVSHVPLHSVPTAESQTASALTWTPALAIPFQFLCTFLQLKWSFTWRYCMTQLFAPNWPPAGVRIKTSSTTACCSGQPWPSRGPLVSRLSAALPLAVQCCLLPRTSVQAVLFTETYLFPRHHLVDSYASWSELKRYVLGESFSYSSKLDQISQ